MKNSILLGDCLELLPKVQTSSVDMILCDLPYGTTRCKWDSVIPLEELWNEYTRVIKPNGAIVLFANQPFTSKLVMSNLEMFKYDWVWEKSRPTGVLNAKKQPLRIKEDIIVFGKGVLCYNPQGLVLLNKYVGTGGTAANQKGNATGKIAQTESGKYLQEYGNYPRNILKFPSVGKTVHPTQKPVELFQYLIETYTNPGDLVLDNCSGSGTTAIACQLTKRDFICMEKDVEYHSVSLNRLKENQN
jgi:site-specific DNA-methyltransferase (adenine-specific)